MLAFEISLYSKPFAPVNVSWHASTTLVHGRDCQNTAVVVGDHAVELGSVDDIILGRKVFETISQSATTVSLCFLLRW